MAVITPVSGSPFKSKVFRTAAAQATTGQTDWLSVPGWAKVAVVTLNLTANAGTTPTTTLSLLATQVQDDAQTADLAVGGSAVSTASQHIYTIGPTVVTAGADSATAGAAVDKNAPIPAFLGVKIVNFRGSADETYTYTLSVEFE